MDPDFINNRIIYGFLGRRSDGKVKYFSRRFFILISAKSLNIQYDDELILDESRIPPLFELDNLYYWNVDDL